MLARDRDLDLRQFLAKNVHRGRQPFRLAAAEESEGQCPFLGVGGAASGGGGGFDLSQREPGMFEKHLARGGQLDAVRAASHQLGTHLYLQLAHLTAQRRLCRMQPPLGGDRDVLLFGHGDEIPEMPQLHGPPMPWGYGAKPTKSFS